MAALRVFAAVSPPHEVRMAVIDQLGDTRIPGRRVPPGNWHITLRFLDEIDEVTCDRYLAALDGADLGKQFNLSLSSLGAFPNERKATVVWAGVATGEAHLYQLAELADDAAVAVGLAAEARPFSPHLTLSRVRPPEPVRELIEQTELDVTWKVKEVVLFQTLPIRGGVKYETIESLQLLR